MKNVIHTTHDDGHDHEIRFTDNYGNGVALAAEDGHEHRIVEWEIMPARIAPKEETDSQHQNTIGGMHYHLIMSSYEDLPYHGELDNAMVAYDVDYSLLLKVATRKGVLEAYMEEGRIAEILGTRKTKDDYYADQKGRIWFPMMKERGLRWFPSKTVLQEYRISEEIPRDVNGDELKRGKSVRRLTDNVLGFVKSVDEEAGKVTVDFFRGRRREPFDRQEYHSRNSKQLELVYGEAKSIARGKSIKEAYEPGDVIKVDYSEFTGERPNWIKAKVIEVRPMTARMRSRYRVEPVDLEKKEEYGWAEFFADEIRPVEEAQTISRLRVMEAEYSKKKTIRKGDSFEDGTYMVVIHPGDNARFNKPGGREEDDEVLRVGEDLWADGDNWEVITIGDDYVKLGIPEEVENRENDKSIGEEKSLDDLRQRIEDEAEYVDVKRYSHNIISLMLGQIAKGYGDEEANKAIEDFGLEDLGWSKKEVKEGYGDAAIKLGKVLGTDKEKYDIVTAMRDAGMPEAGLSGSGDAVVVSQRNREKALEIAKSLGYDAYVWEKKEVREQDVGGRSEGELEEALEYLIKARDAVRIARKNAIAAKRLVKGIDIGGPFDMAGELQGEVISFLSGSLEEKLTEYIEKISEL